MEEIIRRLKARLDYLEWIKEKNKEQINGEIKGVKYALAIAEMVYGEQLIEQAKKELKWKNLRTIIPERKFYLESKTKFMIIATVKQ